mgnify:CR=1 FL=1
MNDSYSILIIEDEKNILDFMSRTLKANGYKTTTVTSGKAGLSIINSQCPDLILLDLGLPDMDGNDIIASVREWTSCPIIVISARTGEHDKVAALDLGADDYITKPFNILEVKARIKAIMRRTEKKGAEQTKSKVIQAGDLTMDCEARRVNIAGREVNLTAKEFDVLELLIFHPNKVYSRENLLNIVWGYEYPGDVRTVDVHIRRLREKIEINPSDPQYVHTKWGVGYYFQHS